MEPLTEHSQPLERLWHTNWTMPYSMFIFSFPQKLQIWDILSWSFFLVDLSQLPVVDITSSLPINSPPLRSFLSFVARSCLASKLGKTAGTSWPWEFGAPNMWIGQSIGIIFRTCSDLHSPAVGVLACWMEHLQFGSCLHALAWICMTDSNDFEFSAWWTTSFTHTPDKN